LWPDTAGTIRLKVKEIFQKGLAPARPHASVAVPLIVIIIVIIVMPARPHASVAIPLIVIIVIIIVMPACGHPPRALKDLVEFPTLQPDSATLRTVINLHALALSDLHLHHACRAQQHILFPLCYGLLLRCTLSLQCIMTEGSIPLSCGISSYYRLMGV
jgi:hypothetical protein